MYAACSLGLHRLQHQPLHTAWGFIICSTSRCIQLGASSFAAPAVGSISYICVMHTAWGFIMAAPAICIAVIYLFVLLMSSSPCRVSLSHLYLYLSFSLSIALSLSIYIYIYIYVALSLSLSPSVSGAMAWGSCKHRPFTPAVSNYWSGQWYGAQSSTGHRTVHRRHPH